MRDRADRLIGAAERIFGGRTESVPKEPAHEGPAHEGSAHHEPEATDPA
jgi:hypothetical protein